MAKKYDYLILFFFILRFILLRGKIILLSGCVKCSTSDDFHEVGSSAAGRGTTDVTTTGGASTETKCHFKSGNYQDTSGKFTLNGTCYYSK